MITLKRGSKNDFVKAIQYILKIDADGIFGKNTAAAVKQYQKTKGLSVDGIVGHSTYGALVNDAPILIVGANNNWVCALECLLQTMKQDGTFTADEKEHVRTFQTAAGLTADGIVGTETWLALFELIPIKQEVSVKQPVDYKQYDSKWKNIIFTKNNTNNRSQTIGNSGCGPTAMADIVATWWDKNVTPVEMCALAVKAGFRTDNSGTAWDFFRYVAKKYNATNFIQTSSYATAENAIKNGAYVVCSMKPGLWTTKGHYICWWKVDNKYVYICDPASAAAKRSKSNKANLKAQAKQYFIFYK